MWEGRALRQEGFSGMTQARVGEQRKQYSDKDLVPNVSSETLFESIIDLYLVDQLVFFSNF